MKFLIALFLVSCAALKPTPEEAKQKLILSAQTEFKKIHSDINRKNANTLTLDPITELDSAIEKTSNLYLVKMLRRAQDLTEVKCSGEITKYEDCQDAKPISLSLREIQIKKQAKFTADICSSGEEYVNLCARHKKLLQHLKSDKYTFTKNPWYNAAVLEEGK